VQLLTIAIKDAAKITEDPARADARSGPRINQRA